tara:strand:- start:1637 stop:3307 length:1671 start_codon:yes stop_codon:yes gene_type:complete
MADNQSTCWQYTKGSLQRIVKGDYAEVFSEEISERYTQKINGSGKPTPRDIFSSYKARNTSQLKYAWGRKEDAGRKSPPFNSNNYSDEMNTCWICGSRVFPGGGVMTSTLLGYPEAEHALFLKYGYAFLSLPAEIFLGKFAPWATAIPRIETNSIQLNTLNWWTQEKRDQGTPKTIQDGIEKDYQFQIKLEMRQSHRLCNQLKSQFNYVRFNKGRKEWQIKETLYDYTIKLLTKTIGNTTNYKKNSESECNKLKFDRFRESLEDIVNYLNFYMDEKPYFIPEYDNLPNHAQEVLFKKGIVYKDLSHPEKYIITRISIKFVLEDAKDNEKYRQAIFKSALEKVLGAVAYTKDQEATEKKQMYEISRQITYIGGKAGSENTVSKKAGSENTVGEDSGGAGPSVLEPTDKVELQNNKININPNTYPGINNVEDFFTQALEVETQETPLETPPRTPPRPSAGTPPNQESQPRRRILMPATATTMEWPGGEYSDEVGNIVLKFLEKDISLLYAGIRENVDDDNKDEFNRFREDNYNPLDDKDYNKDSIFSRWLIWLLSNPS